MMRRPPRSPLFPNTTLSRSKKGSGVTRSREAEALVVLWIHRSPTADLVPDEPQIWRDANDVADLARVVKARWANRRSAEHTSELQSRPHLVCRLLLEQKKSR